MQADEQGVRATGQSMRGRYQVIPRTLLLITSQNPDNQRARAP